MWKNIYLGVITILVILLGYYSITYYKRAIKAEEDYKERVMAFNELDSIVKQEVNKQGEEVTTSIPLDLSHISSNESFLADEVKKLLDSIENMIETPKGSKISSYTTTEFETKVEGKATVKDSLAILEKDNWSLSYNYRDSIFMGKYIGRFHDLVYNEPKKFLGFNYGKGNLISSKWLTDTVATIKSTQSIHNINTPKRSPLIIESETSYRVLDNSVLTGGNIFHSFGRLKLGGSALYNFNTKQIEPEFKIRFGIVE